MHRSHPGIIQAGRDGEGFFDLAVGRLHHQHPGTVQDTGTAAVNRSRGISGIHAVAAGFRQDNLHSFIVHIMINGTGCIAAAADAGDEVVGIVPANLFLQLHLNFL